MTFGKRVTPPQPAPVVPIPHALGKDSPGNASELVAIVVDFVNHLFSAGLYRADEVPHRLIQLYHADFYIAQVLNGGHSQFVHNCGTRRQAILANAMAGLSAMGAPDHAALLGELGLWTAANPNRADAQTGFSGGRDGALDALDKRFEEAERLRPATDQAAAWIKAWPDIRYLDPAGFEATWEQGALSNPRRALRLSKARIEAFRQSLSDPLLLALGLAADAADETLIDPGTTEVIDIGGRREEVRLVQTSFGLRGAACAGGCVRLYALQLGERDVTWTAVSLIGIAERTDVDAITAVVRHEPVAAAADLLLRRARPAATHCVIQAAAMADGIPHPIFRISVADDMLMLTKAGSGYVLAGRAPGDTHGPVSFAQIAAHEREIDGHAG